MVAREALGEERLVDLHASSGPVVNTVTSSARASQTLMRMNQAVLRLTPSLEAHSRSVSRAQKHLANAAHVPAGRCERGDDPPGVEREAAPAAGARPALPAARVVPAAGDPLAAAAGAAGRGGELRARPQEGLLSIPDLDFV